MNLQDLLTRIYTNKQGELFKQYIGLYTRCKGAYKASQLPHLGFSDHFTIMLGPSSRPRVRAIRPTQKEVHVWPEGASYALKDCFITTDQDIFIQAATQNYHTDIEEYSEADAYIPKCIENVTHTQTVTVRAIQKPWLIGEVHRLLRALLTLQA